MQSQISDIKLVTSYDLVIIFKRTNSIRGWAWLGEGWRLSGEVFRRGRLARLADWWGWLSRLAVEVGQRKETNHCTIKKKILFNETVNPRSGISFLSCASCEAFCHYENTSQLVCFNLGLCTFCILWHFSENSSSLKLFKQNFGTLQSQRSLTNHVHSGIFDPNSFQDSEIL